MKDAKRRPGLLRAGFAWRAVAHPMCGGGRDDPCVMTLARPAHPAWER